MTLPTDAKERKAIPIYEGFFKYFPDAIAAVAEHSAKGSAQHQPGEPIRWDRSKSPDELSSLLRHILDEDWTAVAWRAMAHLQKTLEHEKRIRMHCDEGDESLRGTTYSQVENSDSQKLAQPAKVHRAPAAGAWMRSPEDVETYIASLQIDGANA